MSGQRLTCMVLVVMVSTHYLVYSLPVTKSTPASVTTKEKIDIKRNNSLDTIRDRLQQLENIERYYQHLYIRGLLEENDSRLQSLQQMITRLREYLSLNNK